MTSGTLHNIGIDRKTRCDESQILDVLRATCAVFLFLFTSAAAFAAGSPPAVLRSGAGKLNFAQGQKTLPVWYYLPKSATPDAPILFVMHGVGRNAERYRDDWQPLAQKYKFILLVPEFSVAAFPGADAYAYGGTVDAKGQPRPREEWAFSYLEPIFQAIKAGTGNRSERFHLYGHSAGAQFVHRYLYFMPDAPVAAVVAANAGWYTLPDLKKGFPYGLRDSVVDRAALKAMLQRPLVVLLGTADTDPNHPELRRSTQAMAQGPHRLARGQFFYAAGQKQAEALGVPFGWKLATAPGIAHHDSGMAAFAAERLFGRK